MNIGAQIRKRRSILGLTLQQIVDKLDRQGVQLSKAAISKYETGKSVPRATSLYALSKVLECSTEYLLAEPIGEIEWLRFRKKTSLSKRLELEVKESAQQWLQARLTVDETIGAGIADFELPEAIIDSPVDAEGVAAEVRVRWKAGEWPIESLSTAMEKSGVIIVEVDVEMDLDGLSGIGPNQMRFVVVSRGVPTDRMRMNLAHELGHIVIRPSDNEKLDEAIAFRFAASLLIPKSVVVERIGRSRRTIDLRELMILKQEYGVSIQALIRRCFDLDIVTEWTYRQLNIELRTAGWYRNEPGDCSQLERPSQFRSHLLRCVTEGLISEKEMRSMFPDVAKTIDELGSDTSWRWHALRGAKRDDKERILREAAEGAKDEYSADGSLAGLELIDGND